MNRKTLTALAALAVLSLIALFALRAPEKGERRGDRPRPVAKLKSGDFDTIEVTKAKVTSVIKKDGAKYKVMTPTPYPAEENAAKQAFEALEKLEFTDIVTDQKSKHTEFEVDDNTGLRVAAKKGDKLLADMIVGKNTGSGTMVRVPGKDEVWQANGSIKFSFDKAAADWRDKSLTTFTQGDAEKIEVKSKTGGTISLKKGDKKEGSSDEQWAVIDSSVKVPKLDNSIPLGIVSTMASWKTNDFADGAKSEETGLADPALTVTVTLKGGKTATATIGNKKTDEDFFVKTPESPQVFLVKKYNLDRVNKRPIDFRDKTICNIADADLTDLAVTHGADSYTVAKTGSDWKATKPKMELDTAKVTPIAGAFKDWKAVGFAEDPSPKATGLAKPGAVIVAKSKGATCNLKVGDETKDKQNYYLQTAGSPDVYVVAKWAADRVLIKVNDLKKATVAKK
jgi:hypothetical protein